MVEGAMDHAVRLGRPVAQTFRVFEVAAMDFSARGGESLGARVRARQSEHPMAGVDEFGNDGGTDEAGRAGEKYTQGEISIVARRAYRLNYHSGKVVILS